jgi:hypothetical protein
MVPSPTGLYLSNSPDEFQNDHIPSRLENAAGRENPPLIVAAVHRSTGPIVNSGIDIKWHLCTCEPRQGTVQVPVHHPMLCSGQNPKPKYTEISRYFKVVLMTWSEIPYTRRGPAVWRSNSIDY